MPSAGRVRETVAIGKFPVLRDDSGIEIIPEFSIIIEYLDAHYPRPHQIHPRRSDRALQTRLRDRFFDLYVHLPMQKIMRRPACGLTDRTDPHGVEEARAQLRTSYAMIEPQMAHGGWAIGDDFQHRRLRRSRRRSSTAAWRSRSTMRTKISPRISSA